MIRNSLRLPAVALAISLLIFAPAGRAPALEAPTAWEGDWERTVKAAEQEGQVVVYKIASDSEWQLFQKRYPKIKVNLVHASAAQHLQRLMAERRAGKFLADVIRLGGGTSTSLYKAKALEPIRSAFILPEVKDTSKWMEGYLQRKSTGEDSMIKASDLTWDDVTRVGAGTLGGNYLHLLGYNPK